MAETISRETLARDFAALSIMRGDVLLVRGGLRAVIQGGLRAVGRITAKEFVGALLDTIGPEGTLVSLAFTGSTFMRKANPAKPFTASSPTNAGALPTAMLAHPDAKRSRHPTCSYVAIGRAADQILAGHGPDSGAYEPVRTIMNMQGKCVLVGCVRSSPGFTTAHVAEIDLGHHRRVIMPWLSSTYYVDENGETKLFRRKDIGLCSMSFWKYYAHYVRAGILTTGYVGNAYSIMAPASACYEIEKTILSKSPRFNVCDSPDCFVCNARRWDRLHRLPIFVVRKAMQRAGLMKCIPPSA